METYTKTFGQHTVTVCEGEIAIVGSYGSNYGRFYPGDSQVLSMEWDYGLTPSVKKWLYSLARTSNLA